ncbi:MAG: FkbM family methyltransferase [Pseudomonadota bacterium]
MLARAMDVRRFRPPDASTLRPLGRAETALALAARLPGYPGYVAFRKLKRRIAVRSRAAFDAAVAGLGPGDIAVDLGANIGTITRSLAATGATVHAFEPDPETFQHLQAGVGSLPNVHLHNAAAGGRDGTVTLYRPASWHDETQRRSASKAASVAEMAAKRGFEPSGSVPMIDFANFINSLNDVVQLIKVDIEGAEWDLIDAVMARAPDRFEAMFVETHERLDPGVRPLVRDMQARFAAAPAPYVNLFWT